MTLIALTGRLRVIKAALDDLVGLTRWAGDTIWPAQLTDGLITLDIIDEILDIDLHGGPPSEIVEWDGVSIHHPQIHDPGIQYEPVTNAFKVDAAPSGMKARTDREHVRRLQQAGYQVEVTAAYDEHGQPRPTLSAIWRKKR